MLSRNVKAMLLLMALALCYTFVLGCDDTGSDAVGTTGNSKAYSGNVTTSQVKNAIKAIEASGFGVSATAIGAELTAKYGKCNASHDLYKAVGDRCEKMGLSRNCTTK